MHICAVIITLSTTDSSGKEYREDLLDLKELRKSKGLTQQELADQCYVIQQTISHIERGERQPSVDTAKRIGKALGIPWVELFGGDDD